tara:strand:- start:470 stop:1072 length:603 start_codon:yes stop_codon:yes gene_type:complete
MSLEEKVEDACDLADSGFSSLPDALLECEGMSHSKNRHLINNVCSAVGGTYLEVGCWLGTSIMCASWETDCKLIGIDDFSGFWGEADRRNEIGKIQKNLSGRFAFVDADCFSFDVSVLPSVDVFFYDADHSAESQSRAFTYFHTCFADKVVVVVDDLRMKGVVKGTEDGLSKIPFNTTFQRDYMEKGWWNGFRILVLERV